MNSDHADPPSRRSRTTVVATAAVIVGLLVVGALLGGRGDSGSADAADAATGAPVTAETDAALTPEEQTAKDHLAGLARRDADDAAALGPADAPVVVVAYSDYACPFCARWVRDTQPAVIEKYVDEGLVRLEWRDFPVIGGPKSELAAVAAHAAGTQGKYWDFHHTLYDGDNSADSLTRERLLDVATQIGLDVDRFEADLASTALNERMQADYAEGRGIGVTSTPTFLVNGSPIMGAMPTDTFVSAIDDELELAGVDVPTVTS